MDIKSKIAGSLYGMLIGDAMGVPVETWKPEEIRAYYGFVSQMLPSKRYSEEHPAGIHSDDSQQALILCDAILANPENPALEWAKTAVEMYLKTLHFEEQKIPANYGLHRGIGKNFKRMLAYLIENKMDIQNSAVPASGNGIAMFIAPIAWYYRDNIENLAHQLINVATVKSNDIRGIAAAGAVACMVLKGLENDKPQQIVLSEVLEFTRLIEELASERLKTESNKTLFSNALSNAFRNIEKPLPQLFDIIEDKANQTAEKKGGPASAYSLASVVSAIATTLKTTNYVDALITIINLGGDADTTAAMVGAMSGALYGFDSIPKKWYNDLVAAEAFTDRIDAMVAKNKYWKAQIPLIELETNWSKYYYS